MMETSCGQFVAVRPGFLPRARTVVISIRAHIFSYEVTVMTVKKTVMNRIKSDSYQVSPFMASESKRKRLLRNVSITRSGYKGCWFFLWKCLWVMLSADVDGSILCDGIWFCGNVTEMSLIYDVVESKVYWLFHLLIWSRNIFIIRR